MKRTEGKYNKDYGIIDMYKFYKKEQKEKKAPIVSFHLFSKILKYHNKEVVKEIVENAGELRMPYRLGYVRIRKFKQRIKFDANGKLKTQHLRPDWKATKKLWAENEEAALTKKLVWHTNTHSRGFYYKWYWDKRACNITNSSAYSLIISRGNKRAITKAIKENDNLDYYE
jgi:hypothetical protein